MKTTYINPEEQGQGIALARALQKWSDLQTENAQLREALASLANEVSGMIGIIEPVIRVAAGNTNFVCLENRMKEARAILAAVKAGAS